MNLMSPGYCCLQQTTSCSTITPPEVMERETNAGRPEQIEWQAKDAAIWHSTGTTLTTRAHPSPQTIQRLRTTQR